MTHQSETELARLLRRARSEYIEMPGLSLAPAQAARLWALDRSTSQHVLDRLVDTGFLMRTREGHYLRPSEERQW
jgi:hypothetical protein